jgi:hypothetical protein
MPFPNKILQKSGDIGRVIAGKLLCILPNLHRKYSAVENRFRKDPPLQRRRGRNQANRIEKTRESPATEYTKDTR